MLSLVLPLLFPSSGEREELCSRIEQLRAWPVLLDRVALQQRGITSINSVCAACMYDDVRDIRRAIHLLKYVRARECATSLAMFMAQAMRDQDYKDAVLCPVPLHWSRRFARGFNQAELLAQECSVHTHMRSEKLLKRIRATGHQAHRTKEQRQHALDGAFTVQQHLIGAVPKHVVLVDDVGTTLSTLQECARILLAAGVTRVDAVVVALA